MAKKAVKGWFVLFAVSVRNHANHTRNYVVVFGDSPSGIASQCQNTALRVSTDFESFCMFRENVGSYIPCERLRFSYSPYCGLSVRYVGVSFGR